MVYAFVTCRPIVIFAFSHPNLCCMCEDSATIFCQTGLGELDENDVGGASMRFPVTFESALRIQLLSGVSSHASKKHTAGGKGGLNFSEFSHCQLLRRAHVGTLRQATGVVTMQG